MDKMDRIERSVTITAPIERVWEAITDAGEVAQWFGDVVEIELRPGGRARFGWSEYDSVIDAVIEVVEPLHHFAYRWAADKGVKVEDGPSTLVEFTLSTVEGGTEVVVVESGFADLPDDIYKPTLEDNTSGWRAELRDLEDYLRIPQGV